MAESSRLASTDLSSDERDFRDAIRSFAEGEIKPRVRHMDENAAMDKDLIPKLFQ